MKKLFFSYQKAFFYVNVFKGEYAKIGSFIPETLMIMTFLTVRGVEVKTWYIPVFYIGIVIISGLIGKFLVLIGVSRYNNKLSNKQNEELMEILEILRKQK